VEAEEFQRRLGQAIQAGRKDAGLTQEGLAERLGSAPEWVSQVERGVGVPSLSMLLRIAEALDVPPSVLMESAGAEAGPDLQVLQQRARRLQAPAVRVLVALAAALEQEYGGSG
jgi:transcriptional regulator with XRE-family HTH domain